MDRDPKTLRGEKTPSDQKFPVTVRDWNALKQAAWRSKTLSEITAREAQLLIDSCDHVDACGAREIESEPCDPRCPDRERRMSALVILNAARQLAPEDARRPADEPYFAPSREYYSEVLAALASAQIEIKILQSAMRDAGLQVPQHPALDGRAPLELT